MRATMMNTIIKVCQCEHRMGLEVHVLNLMWHRLAITVTDWVIGRMNVLSSGLTLNVQALSNQAVRVSFFLCCSLLASLQGIYIECNVVTNSYNIKSFITEAFVSMQSEGAGWCRCPSCFGGGFDPGQ